MDSISTAIADTSENWYTSVNSCLMDCFCSLGTAHAASPATQKPSNRMINFLIVMLR